MDVARGTVGGAFAGVRPTAWLRPLGSGGLLGRSGPTAATRGADVDGLSGSVCFGSGGVVCAGSSRGSRAVNLVPGGSELASSLARLAGNHSAQPERQTRVDGGKRRFASLSRSSVSLPWAGVPSGASQCHATSSDRSLNRGSSRRQMKLWLPNAKRI